MLFLIALIWGGTFVAVKGALDSVDPLTFLFLRFFIATVIFVLAFSGKLSGLTRDTLKKGIILGVLLFLGYAFQTTGLQYTSASKSGFITGLLVVFTPIFQWGIERRTPKVGNIIGVVLVSIGLWLLMAPDESDLNIGDGLTFLCAILFALYIVYLDIYSKGQDAIHLTFLQLGVITVLSLIAALGTEEISITYSTRFLVGLGYTGVLATVLTTYLQTRYQRDTTPTRAAVIFTLEPVFAAVFAYLILKEIIGLLGLLGGALIFSGLVVSELADVLNKFCVKFLGLRFVDRQEEL
ncbi:MAG: DMT family transporter [Bacteroidota bacterium]